MSTFLEQILSPFRANKTPPRSASQQHTLDQQTAGLALYHFPSCPFCIKTRMAIRRLGLTIELKDIQRDPLARQALFEGGGRTTVPCLRIATEKDVTWMYESGDIIRYLTQLSEPRN